MTRKEYQKQWHIENKERIKQHRKEIKQHIYEQRKQYRQDNKEKIKTAKALYYQENKSKIIKQQVKSRKEVRQINPAKAMLDSAKERSRAGNIELNITIDDIQIPSHCPILGIRLERHKDKAQDSSPSLDRIDNTKGYIKGNVCVISNKANKIKNIGNAEEHYKIAEYISRMIDISNSKIG